MPTPLDVGLAKGRLRFIRFVEAIPRAGRTVGLHDSDADGITAGVVWQRAFERGGFANVVRIVPNRERDAWADANRAKVVVEGPDALFVMDLGSRSEPVAEGVRTCFVDHHRPEGVPVGDTLVSAYDWSPIPNTSLLMWELCSVVADVSDLDWIAAVGVLSDLGDRAPFEMLAVAKKKYTAKYLKEVTALVNASRRASRYDPESAARALLEHPDPRSLATSESADVERMREAREEVRAALDEAKKAAPIFSGKVALVRVDSACQIHPLVAQIWRTRLPKYYVIVANEGYLPGKVNFSARSSGNENVLDFLGAIDLPEGEGSFGKGHDQASGGSLPVERWNALLAALGFPGSAGVRPA